MLTPLKYILLDSQNSRVYKKQLHPSFWCWDACIVPQTAINFSFHVQFVLGKNIKVTHLSFIDTYLATPYIFINQAV